MRLDENIVYKQGVARNARKLFLMPQGSGLKVPGPEVGPSLTSVGHSSSENVLSFPGNDRGDFFKEHIILKLS